jgi:hypothetical protein
MPTCLISGHLRQIKSNLDELILLAMNNEKKKKKKDLASPNVSGLKNN